MIALWWALAAGAHPLSPSVLRIDETDGVRATWRTPRARPVGTALLPILPCDPIGPPVSTEDGTAIELSWTLDCGGVVTREVGVEGLVESGPNVLVQWTTVDGSQTVLLHADRPRIQLGGQPRPAVTLWQTFGLGVTHLWSGLDHVLFVCGLMLAVPVRRLAGAITAFTVGHGISLALAGTGWLTLPQAPVEVAIAGSLVWLAAELLGPGESRIARRPIALCLPFGMVHGLGFAGAWLESGMAESSTARALLGFNLGLELGQLGLVALVWAAMEWFGRPEGRWRQGLCWAGGAVAAMWVWERAALALG